MICEKHMKGMTVSLFEWGAGCAQTSGHRSVWNTLRLWNDVREMVYAFMFFEMFLFWHGENLSPLESIVTDINPSCPESLFSLYRHRTSPHKVSVSYRRDRFVLENTPQDFCSSIPFLRDQRNLNSLYKSLWNENKEETGKMILEMSVIW